MREFILSTLGLAMLLGSALHAQNLAGTWQGVLEESPTQRVRTILRIVNTVNGISTGELYRLDPGVGPIPVTSIALQGKSVKFAVVAMDVTYEGKLSADGASITGTWMHGSVKQVLDLVRVVGNSAWAIPVSPVAPKPMPAGADPGFEVATIKPSAPDRQGKDLGFEGRHFTITGFNVNDLIAFAYGLHAKQIVGAPAWFGTEFYDINGVPDVEGEPNYKQLQSMAQKLLSDRFKLAFHHEKRELAVYAITVGKGGPKLTKSTVGKDDVYDFSFRGRHGALMVRNLTMADFAVEMQAVVMDKPVVDQTGLTDRYDFNLDWTPDSSQFPQYKASSTATPPVGDDANQPPGLYTAIQEQLGLKLEPVKAPDDVVVIDHVERPSAN